MLRATCMENLVKFGRMTNEILRADRNTLITMVRNGVIIATLHVGEIIIIIIGISRYRG